MTTTYGPKDLLPYEPVVLFAWAKRQISRAEQTLRETRASTPRTEYRDELSEHFIGEARRQLRAAEAHVGPAVTVSCDPDDTGCGSITFSVETLIWGACIDAAAAMMWCRSRREDPALLREEEAAQIADLTKTIGVKAW